MESMIGSRPNRLDRSSSQGKSWVQKDTLKWGDAPTDKKQATFEKLSRAHNEEVYLEMALARWSAMFESEQTLPLHSKNM